MNIEGFCKEYNLGTVKNITKLTGGLMHKMFKAETDKNIYVIKVLNKEVMNVIVLLFAFVLITSCGGQKKQANEDVQNVQLKGEEVPIDTALFRYAYRIRVQGDKAVVFDLHNVDYYYHVFTYPSFKYISLSISASPFFLVSGDA